MSNAATARDPGIDEHLRRVAEDGYTILPDAIEPDLVAEIDEALLKLERDLGTVPADNLFEGLHTTRVYNLLVHGADVRRRSRCIPTSSRSSRASSIPGR